MPDGMQDIREVDSARDCKNILNSVIDAKLGDRLLAQILHEQKSEEFLRQFIKKDGSRSVLAKGLIEGIESDFAPPDVLLKTVDHLADTVASLHKTFWDGKQNGQRSFKKIIQRYLKDRDEKRLKLGLEQNLRDDHMSLQAFKAIYAELFKNDLKSEATAFFNQFYHLYCKHQQMRDSLAQFLDECNSDSHSQTVLETGVKTGKNDYYYAKELAVKALKQKDYKGVKRWCLKMISINPRIGEAYNILGVSLKKQGKVRKAIREYKKGALMDPTNTKLLHNLAIAYAAIGKEQESLEAYRKAHHVGKLEEVEIKEEYRKASA
jgi:tetratricopeptide (TPR) repeat protein